MTTRIATVLGYACAAVGGFSASVVWVLTGSWLAATITLALGLIAGLLWLCGPGEVADDIGMPHPLDPHTEDLRRRIAMGRLADRAPRRRAGGEERGL